MEAKPEITFLSFRLDVRNQPLWRGTKLVELRPKSWAVLHYLVENPARLIPRGELLQAVWPKQYVTPGLVKGCMRELRAALGDEAETPRFIETVGRQGYRFIAPLSAAQLMQNAKGKMQKPTPPTSTIVGREAELEQLYRALKRARGGERQVVFVTGEPGIGKTTVVDTFLAQLGEEQLATLHPHHSAIIGRGQCIEHYGQGEAYLPVLEALGLIRRGSDGEQLIAVLRQYAPSWLVQMPAFLASPAELETLQRTVAGVTRERMLRELVEALDALTAERLLVLVLEDLHWSDYSTVEWLSAVAQRRTVARLLIVGTYRSTEVSLHEHPLKGVKRELQAHRQCEELAMQFLTPNDIAHYLAARYPRHQFPAAFAPALHGNTEGNPLFLVSLIDYLVAQGTITEKAERWQLRTKVEDLVGQVPESIRQLIEKQIERLSPDDQEVLEVASVVGSEFSTAVVAAGIEKMVGAVEKRCEHLVRREQFLQRRETTEWPDGTVAARYGFGHAPYQEVLYERVAAGRRIVLHRRIGTREEAAYGSRAGEIAAELAVHFERGRDYRRAVQYHQQAAQTAIGRSAHSEAITHLSKGLELLKTLPDTPERTQHELTLQIALGTQLMAIKGFGALEVGEAYARARVLCQQIGDAPQFFPALWGMRYFYHAQGEYQTARKLAEQCLALAQAAHDSALLVEAHAALGDTLFLLGELVPARAYLEQGIALYDPWQHHSLALQYGQDPKVISLALLAATLWALGYPEQAVKRIQEALTLGRELAHPYSLSLVLVVAACLHWFRWEERLAQEWAEAAVRLCTEQGFPLWLAMGTVVRGWALVEQGRTEEGIIQIHKGIAAYRATGAEVTQSWILTMLDQAYGKAGQPQEGLQVVAEGLAVVDKTGQRLMEVELSRLKGELTLQSQTSPRPIPKKSKASQDKSKSSLTQVQGQSQTSQKANVEAEAEACFLRAIEVARMQEAKSLELRAVMSLSRLWQQQGKQKEARRMLAEIYSWFTEGFDTADLKDAKALLEELSR